MKVNINRTNIINGYATRDITAIEATEFDLITSSLEYRLESLEKRLEDYKSSDFEKLKEFIPKTEIKIEQLKRLIEKMQ